MNIRIAMLAPLSPYRGGIAQHSTMLANALASICDLQLYSFSRLYPKFLYPGAFQKDESSGEQLQQEARFVVDSLNPLNWLKVAKEIERSGARLLIVPWWTFFLAPCYLMITRYLSRKGVQVVFVVHNFVDHESTLWKKKLSELVLKNADLCLMHAESIRADVEQALPAISCLVRPMPVYDSYPDVKEVLPRRAGLELLFFGFVRPYKGLDVLLRAVAAMPRSDWFLSVVGECWANEHSYIELAERLGIFDRIEFSFRYVGDAEAASYIDRADFLVLPYKSATGSAVIPLAYNYGTPVIATPVGGLPEVVESGVTGIVLPDISEESLASVLNSVTAEQGRAFGTGIARWRASNTWDELAKALLRHIGSGMAAGHSGSVKP